MSGDNKGNSLLKRLLICVVSGNKGSSETVTLQPATQHRIKVFITGVAGRRRTIVPLCIIFVLYYVIYLCMQVDV